ncbi:GspE/PulE family protein [Chloroflexota bacterium]
MAIEDSIEKDDLQQTLEGNSPRTQVAEEADTGSDSKHQRYRPETEALELIPEQIARRYSAIPLAVNGKTLSVAMAKPSDVFALEALEASSGMRIKTMLGNTKQIRDAIDFAYKGYSEITEQLSRIPVSKETDDTITIDTDVNTPIVQALNLIIEEAVKAHASDIHFEPQEKNLRLRFRIDGILQELPSLPFDVHAALISRLKILADMNIADHYHMQDGQISTVAKGRDIDIRVATAPTVNGEMAVLRLLEKSMATLSLSDLGMLPEPMEKYESMLRSSYGMILTSGPTGAGKTTTLYASINSLDAKGRNILTIEDPAEYRFGDINQIQIHPQAGITFPSGLRGMLRLDPDVIMIGEIRDNETAQIATQAALTGHLMLSCVHSNDAASVLSRLIDLGVEPFLIASVVIGVAAQRMVRRICPDCGQLSEVSLVEQEAYERETGEKKTRFLYGSGCESCLYTGYLGRTGIFEIMSMSEEIRGLVHDQAPTGKIRNQALKEGMITMMQDGIHKVRAGITTPSEVVRSAYRLE